MPDTSTPRINDINDAIERLKDAKPIITTLGEKHIQSALNLKHYFIGGSQVVLQEEAMRALLKAQRDLWDRRQPQTIQVVSSYRSWVKQAWLYARYRSGLSKLPAAPPGRSYHNIALAIDIANRGERSVRHALEKYGWHWLGSSDPVHYSYKVRG